MENNEMAVSSVQPDEKEQEMSSIDRAKELFEYEMTDVLLNFRNEVSQLRNDPNAEFMKMEFKKPEFEFSAPGLTVQNVDVAAADGKPVELAVQSEGVSVDVGAVRAAVGAVPDTAGVNAGFVQPPAPVVGTVAVAPVPGAFAGAVFTPAEVQTEKISISLPDTKVNATPDISVDIAKPSLSVAVPDGAVKGDIFTAGQAPAVESVRVAAAEETKIDTALFDIPAPSVSGISVSIDESGFDEKVVSPEFPAPEAEIEYPEMPEKPDFSAYIEDILASVGAEL